MTEVTWYPVSETPVVGIHVDEFWVCIAEDDIRYVDIGRYYPPSGDNGHWKDVAGNDIDDVITHWAYMIPPPLPEEERDD